MARSKKKSASKVAVPAPASSPVKPLKNRKRGAENELVRAKKRKGPKKGKPGSESHSDRSGVEEVAVAAPPTPPSNGRSEEEKSTGFGGSKTLVFKNIPYHAQKAEILEFFKSAGEVVGVRLFTRKEDDSFRGRGLVVFATAEEAQKALLELNGKKFLERLVKLFLHKEEEKVECGEKSDGSQTLIFKNISHKAQKADVLEFFKSAGEVVDVRLAKKEDDSFKGSGVVVFATAEEAQRALLELNGKYFLQRSVLLSPGKEEKKKFDGSNTLIFKNISHKAQKADVLEFFKSAGEVVDVHLAMNEDDSFKGRGHVVFASAEEAQKALLELNGKKLLQRPVLLFPGREKKKVECGKTLLIKNLPFEVQKADVLEFFKPAGEVVDVRLAQREGDSFKRYAHVDFATAEQAEKALLELKGKKFYRRPVKLTRNEEKEGEGSTGGKTLVVHNLSSKVKKAAILKFFKPAGEVVDVRFATREGDSSKGYGHVDFATAEQAEKALQELNGKKLLQRAVKLLVEEPRLKADGRGGGGRGPSKDTPETGANTVTVGDE